MSSINREKLAKNMRKFALKKPGFEIENYCGNFEAYMFDYNSYKKDADFNTSAKKSPSLYRWEMNWQILTFLPYML